MSEEFLSFLETQSSGNTNVNAVPDLSITADGRAVHRTNTERRQDALAKKYRSSDGTPISFDESPLSFMERGAMSMRRNPEDKVAYLQNTAGFKAGNVRLVGDTPIVRVTDENGNPRDIVADEENLTWKDLADMSSAVPEIAGALAVVLGRGRANKGKPLPKGWFSRIGNVLKESFFAAAGRP